MAPLPKACLPTPLWALLCSHVTKWTAAQNGRNAIVWLFTQPASWGKDPTSQTRSHMHASTHTLTHHYTESHKQFSIKRMNSNWGNRKHNRHIINFLQHNKLHHFIIYLVVWEWWLMTYQRFNSSIYNFGPNIFLSQDSLKELMATYWSCTEQIFISASANVVFKYTQNLIVHLMNSFQWLQTLKFTEWKNIYITIYVALKLLCSFMFLWKRMQQTLALLYSRFFFKPLLHAPNWTQKGWETCWFKRDQTKIWCGQSSLNNSSPSLNNC